MRFVLLAFGGALGRLKGGGFLRREPVGSRQEQIVRECIRLVL